MSLSVKKYKLGYILITLLLLLSLGTFYDYSISLHLVNRESFLGFLGANYGQIIAYIALSSGGLLLVHDKQRFNQLIGCVGIAVSVVMVISDAFKYASHYFGVACIGLCINFIGAFILATYLKNHGLNVTKWGYFLIGCVVAQVVIITIGKEIMVRPRMIAILEHQMSFQPWYQCNFDDKKLWLSMVSNADYLKSFPSGHSGAASMSFAIALALSHVRRCNTKWYMLLASMYTFTVMLSRIIMGAHFLTDTCMGALIGIVCIIGMYYLLFKRSN